MELRLQFFANKFVCTVLTDNNTAAIICKYICGHGFDRSSYYSPILLKNDIHVRYTMMHV